MTAAFGPNSANPRQLESVFSMTPSLRACVLLIPSSGLDDFPESLRETDAGQVLAAWLALWHPQLVAATHGRPRWQSANQPPHDLSQTLVIVPDCAQPMLPGDFGQTVQQSGGIQLAASPDWRSMQAQCLSQLGVPEGAISDHLQAEFAALGYAYLQIELLTRQLRYTSNLDQLLFDSQLDQAAQAAIAGDIGQAEAMLQSCFDQLGQERDHYYSLDVSLLDVTLLAESTLGPAVIAQLARDLPTTFVASAHLLRQMRISHGASFEQLQRAVAERRAAIAGGLDVERPHPLMNFDTLKRDLWRGQAAYRQLGLEPPTVFTRFSFGQSSEMPLHLRRSGYAGCMLIAWQDGHYPSGSHAKFSWEASEGTFLNALAPPLVDAQSAATYLTLGKRIAEALDHQHVPVFMMAHWPNHYCHFFDLLARVVKRTPALGRWLQVDDFFDKTDQPYHQEHLPARKFVYDWFGSPLASRGELPARTMQYHRWSVQARTLQNILNLCWQLEQYHQRISPAPADSATEPISEYADPGLSALSLDQLDAPLAAVVDQLDAAFDMEPDAAAIEAALAEAGQRIATRFATASGYSVAKGGTSGAASQPAGMLVINPTSAPQRLPLASPPTAAPLPGGKWLYASGESGRSQLAMVDLPGYSALPVPLGPPAAALKRQATLVPGEGLLQNDFLEVQIDPRSGALRSLHVPGVRGNRLSVQVARRGPAGTTGSPTGSATSEYSQMQLTQLSTVENSTLRGWLRAVGVLLWGKEPTARFQIDYQLLRGQRLLMMTIRLNQMLPLESRPWKSGYVVRTAWPSEAAIVTTRSSASRQTFSSGHTVAGELIHIDDVDHHTYLLPAGLAFHQRVEQRFLDTLLSTGSQPEGEYHLGIGVDLPNAYVTAQQFLQPTMAVPLAASPRLSANPAECQAAWLMHLDAKSVTLNLEAPLVNTSGHLAGMRVHLSELIGKSITARIRALREVAEAHRVDYLGNRIAKLTVEGDTTSIAMRPNEMTFVDLLWK